jgi:hypothetical protein
MSEALKKPNPSTPESYSPKNKPEILSMAQHATFATDTIGRSLHPRCSRGI